MAASYIHNDGQHSEVNVHQAKIPEKEILNVILRSANMEGAIFNHTVFSDSLYKAECIINISRVDAFQISGKTKIEGQLKNGPIDAENSAAETAIKMFEKIMQTEVVDYNYTKLTEQQGNILMVRGVKVILDGLAYAASGVWTVLMKKWKLVGDCQHKLCHLVADVTENAQERNVLLKCARVLENAFKELNSRHHNAVVTLIDSIN